MEWKKVRNWLILLLLAVDLLLAGNLGLQLLHERQLRYQASADAVALAQDRGIALTAEQVFRLPETLPVCRGVRSGTLEQQTALALLGSEATAKMPGGGVFLYESENGQVSFRRGGAVEMHVPWSRSTFGAEDCMQMLQATGFTMEHAVPVPCGEGVCLMQQQEDFPIFNSRISCTLQGDRLSLSGRWLLSEQLEETGVSMSRAQMVIALCQLLEEHENDRLTGLEAGYYMQSESAQSVLLEPVWQVETEGETFILSGVTGRLLNF